MLGVAASYGYFRWQYGRIPTLGGLNEILRGDDNDPGDPMNVLLVGSDTRATIGASETKSFGNSTQVAGQRSDTIIILHVDPRHERAAMLSIPRDLFVPIAGTKGTCQGTSMRCNRINTAFEGGTPEEGAKNLIATIQDNLGIDIAHYVQVDFVGFRSLVDAVGGVDVYVPSKARDRVTGLRVDTPGCVRFDGNMALAWVRSRNYEYFESGRWRTDPTSDFGRIQRQQDFIRRSMKRALQKGARNPVVLQKLVNTGVKNVKIDRGFSPNEMLDLAKRFKSLEPGAVETYTLPTDRQFVGGADVQVLRESEAKAALDKFLGVGLDVVNAPPPKVAPSEVQIRVLNGSGKGGQASEASSALTSAGYNVVGAGDADTFKYTFTEIRYGKGQKDKAALVQSQVKGRSKLREDATLRGAEVVLITGSEYAGLSAATGATATTPAPSPSAPATSTPSATAKPTGDAAASQC